MRQDIASLFGLKGYLVDGMEVAKSEVKIHARVASTGARCPACNTWSSRIHQRHDRRVLHDMVSGKKLVLMLTVRRFKCRCSKRIFTEIPPLLVPHGRRTQNQKESLLLELAAAGFRRAAERHGVSAMTAYRDLQKAPVERGVVWPKRGEVSLGIDGHSVRGREMAMTVCELKRGRTLAVLEDDHLPTLKGFLKEIPKETAGRIVEVCMDLDRGQCNAVKDILPWAQVVADRFHVIKLANELIDDVRRIVQDGNKPIHKKLWLKGKERLTSREFARLMTYAEAYPKLFTLWLLKEDLRQVYECRNKRVAAFRLKKVIQGYAQVESGYAKAFARTLLRWRVEILNFFERRTTNASVESRHQKFKLVQRVSYGFRNIHSYLSKVMLASVPLWLVLRHTIC